MQPQHNDLEVLARRVQEGDFEAKAQLKHEIEPSMARIVRRVLAKGHASSSLERKILAAARRLAPNSLPSDDDPRTAPLAHNLCQLVVNRLWPGATEISGAWQQTVTA